MQELINRLRKRQKHLKKWARRTGLTCYRLYERDIPTIPLIVDWYDDSAVIWLCLPKGKETTPALLQSLARWEQAIAEALDISPEKIYSKERHRRKDEGQYEKFDQKKSQKFVKEYNLNFEVNLTDYLDTGLFLDHRATRKIVRDEAANKRFLNLFAYTGAFTCYALAGGATHSMTVDMSNTYCEWAKRNLVHNGFTSNKQHQVVQQDCLTWLKEAVSQKQQYDLIVCDPPTHSNSKRMLQSFFSVDLHHPELISACAELLSPGGTLYFSTNSRKFKLSEDKLPKNLSWKNISKQTLPEDFRNKKIHQCWRFVKAEAQ